VPVDTLAYEVNTLIRDGKVQGAVYAVVCCRCTIAVLLRALCKLSYAVAVLLLYYYVRCVSCRMLSHVISCSYDECAVLCYAVLFCAMLCCAMLCCAVVCCAVL
jgi:hypothetical protein